MHKLKNEDEVIAVKGIAQTFSGSVSDDLYKLIIKADPRLKDKFEKVDESEHDSKSKKKSAPLSDNV